jgi:hypothetical protein
MKLLMALLLTACSSAAEALPSAIVVTPSPVPSPAETPPPAPTDSPVVTAPASASPSSSSVTATPSGSASASPSATDPPTAAPSDGAVAVPVEGIAVPQELQTEGTLGTTLDQFTAAWNEVDDSDEGLRLEGAWGIFRLGDGTAIADHGFDVRGAPEYADIGLVGAVNADDTVRSMSVQWLSLDRSAIPIVLSAHTTLVDVVAADVSQAARDDALELIYPRDAQGRVDLRGADAAVEVGGWRFRLVDQGPAGILLIAREANLPGP